ncbi:MAG: hypothetical protein JWQ71_4874 [Pedosphaera sp.]|nr:hypothetical protein [Pedosphaera sp.]
MRIAKPEENDSELEFEGRYMALERRLWVTDRERAAKVVNAPLEKEFQERQFDRIHVEGGNDYESQGNGIQPPDQGHIRPPEYMEGEQLAGNPDNKTSGGATDWQDYGDYEPGYSGHQRTPRRRVLPSESFASKAGRARIKKVARQAKTWKGRQNSLQVLQKKKRNR